MTTAYLKIMTDLSKIHPEDALFKSTRQKKKQNSLVYAFYLGQLLEVFTKLPAKRTILKSHLTKYYALAMTHTYYIFERWEMEQIMRTSKISLRTITNLIDSIQGKPKIIARGYLLVKDKSCDKKYYWYCEYKNAQSCHKRAITILEGQEHASTTLDHLAQIIQNTVTEMLQNSYSYMPNTNALRKQINYVRKKHSPPQPLSLQAINIPINLYQTINGEQFLAKDIEYSEEKIMIFCTIQNLQ
ncbi:45392_t:CDS:2 [Gigaspora margarita]|uniref:45392_t:CDS:1 n=1 Tax=Gigaspora margarita TaxID=4874 RepID=A0ABM8W4H5_GIGMA|nr:45392_t:CDS:2 [Gigaspora margarita]